jgi:predicted Co/Zn/Cd cation transporter (cation efflux family)
MKRWIILAIASGLLLLGASFAFLNFFAAADLGYDMYPGGKGIIARYLYSTLGLLVVSMACAILAWRARRAQVRAQRSGRA